MSLPVTADEPPCRQLISFIAGQYVSNSVSNVITYVPQLLVLHLLGAEAAAYVNVPWLIEPSINRSSQCHP